MEVQETLTATSSAATQEVPLLLEVKIEPPSWAADTICPVLSHAMELHRPRVEFSLNQLDPKSVDLHTYPPYCVPYTTCPLSSEARAVQGREDSAKDWTQFTPKLLETNRPALEDPATSLSPEADTAMVVHASEDALDWLHR
jgi:hypothetical protein